MCTRKYLEHTKPNQKPPFCAKFAQTGTNTHFCQRLRFLRLPLKHKIPLVNCIRLWSGKRTIEFRLVYCALVSYLIYKRLFLCARKIVGCNDWSFSIDQRLPVQSLLPLDLWRAVCSIQFTVCTVHSMSARRDKNVFRKVLWLSPLLRRCLVMANLEKCGYVQIVQVCMCCIPLGLPTLWLARWVCSLSPPHSNAAASYHILQLRLCI